MKKWKVDPYSCNRGNIKSNFSDKKLCNFRVLASTRKCLLYERSVRFTSVQSELKQNIEYTCIILLSNCALGLADDSLRMIISYVFITTAIHVYITYFSSMYNF